ncbi:MAG: hypothetical protein ABL908_05700, partial [Hyphomicrobium sp.]
RPPVQNQPIDRLSAKDNLKYGVLARDSYRTDTITGQPSPVTGFARDKIKQGPLGFNATIYRNNKTNEVVVAFRGTEVSSPKDLATDVYARYWVPGMPIPSQYRFARQVADEARASCAPPCKITLTGHSLGGALASYAGQSTDQVVTFNAARNRLTSAGHAGSQLNVVVSGDPTGDVAQSGASGKMFGIGALPGKTVTVQTTSPNLLAGDLPAPDGTNPWFGFTYTHPLNGTLGGMFDAQR